MVSAQSLIGILTGPTASGKTSLALEFCRRHPEIEIVNADSVVVYRGLDIGSAKPSRAERSEIPHHLVDIRDPDEPYTAGEFHADVNGKIEEIFKRGKRPLIVGGTGFYLKALLYGLWGGGKADPSLREELESLSNEDLHARVASRDPESAARIGPADRYRLIRSLELMASTGKTPTELQNEMPTHPDSRFALWVLDREGEEMESRIRERARQMLDQGVIEEVKALRAKFGTARSLRSVGYAQVCDYLDGIAPEGRKVQEGIKGLEDEIVLATRQLVKRQRTWFRGEASARWFFLERDREHILSAMEETYL